jgi:(2Fe-2S) ferredoxin
MKSIRSLEDLQKFRERVIEQKAAQAKSGSLQIKVGLGSCGIAAGALDVLRVLMEQIPAKKLKEISITPTGCIGLCAHEPIVEVSSGPEHRVTYGRVSLHAAQRIVEQHVLGGRVVEELLIDTTPFPTI